MDCPECAKIKAGDSFQSRSLLFIPFACMLVFPVYPGSRIHADGTIDPVHFIREPGYQQEVTQFILEYLAGNKDAVDREDIPHAIQSEGPARASVSLNRRQQ